MTEFQQGYLMGIIITSIVLTIAHFYFLYKKAEETENKTRKKLQKEYEEALECRPHLWEKYNYKPKKPIDPNLRWKFDSQGDPIYYRINEQKNR